MNNNKRKGHVITAVDKDFAEMLTNFKESVEEQLGRKVSMPVATSLLCNVFPKNVQISKVWVNDKTRRNRTVQFMVEYLMEEI